MNKEDLYYIYRIQYENLINDLDRYIFYLDKCKISKSKIRNDLIKIFRDNYDKTYLLKDDFEKEWSDE